MNFDTLRVYSRAGVISVSAPDWYHEANLLSEQEHLDWHKAIGRVLGAEHQSLTVEPVPPAYIEINFWRSPAWGSFVVIETPLEFIEHVLVPDPADWLLFMTTHLVPLQAAVGQMAIAAQLERLTNAVIAFGRHGSGEHIDRESGRSGIDARRDAGRTNRMQRAR
jgi:hypothetical protein